MLRAKDDSRATRSAENTHITRGVFSCVRLLRVTRRRSHQIHRDNSPSHVTDSPIDWGSIPQAVTKDRARTQGYSALSLSPLLGPQRGDPSCTPYMTLVFREIQIQSENRPARGSAPGEIFDQNVRSVRSRFSGRVRGPFQIFLVRPENILVGGLVTADLNFSSKGTARQYMTCRNKPGRAR